MIVHSEDYWWNQRVDDQIHHDEYGPLASMADAHREWHHNTGVPMGQPGCPQDACHPIDEEEYGDDDGS